MSAPCRAAVRTARPRSVNLATRCEPVLPVPPRTTTVGVEVVIGSSPNATPAASRDGVVGRRIQSRAFGACRLRLDRAGEAFGHVFRDAIGRRPLAIEQVLAERAKAVAQQLLRDSVAPARIGADLHGERSHSGVKFVLGDNLVDEA